jgi:hypothetical protein
MWEPSELYAERQTLLFTSTSGPQRRPPKRKSTKPEVKKAESFSEVNDFAFALFVELFQYPIKD